MMFLTLWSSYSGTDSQPAPSSHTAVAPDSGQAAGCFGKCKSSILSAFSQGNPNRIGAPRDNSLVMKGAAWSSGSYTPQP
jgi:hypothetical protein